MSNTSRLIGQDCAITLLDGGPFVVGGMFNPNGNTTLTITAYAKSVKLKNKQNVVDLRGFGDGFKRNRPTYQEYEITVELLIENTGVVPINVGNIVYITAQPQSDLSSWTYYGVLTQNDFDISMDQAQTQTLTIESGYDAV